MVELSPFANAIFKRTYAFTPDETWPECAYRVANAVADNQRQRDDFFAMIRDRILIPGGRYLYSAGRPRFINSNCYGFVAGDSREEWARLLHDIILCLSTGGGLGVNYSDVRPSGAPIRTLGGVASGPLALMEMINEVARHVMAGGKRRSALWAGLDWRHGDILKFITAKDWNEDIKRLKAKYPEAAGPLDMTNISVIIDDQYLTELRAGINTLHRQICESMCRTGEPAFRNQALILRDDPLGVTGNACQESTLADRDTCNLASIVLPRVKDLIHLEQIVRRAIQFLFNGSCRAGYPTPGIERMAARHRRLGLGIMGLHEHLLANGLPYAWHPSLKAIFKAIQEVADDEAIKYSRRMNQPKPVTTRAIAPTGTISIIAETTSGIEPIYCLAYKRRYIDGRVHKYQYVVDPTAHRLLQWGIPIEQLEDAYSLSTNLDRRLELQANVQEYIDQGISNTVNLPEWGTPGNDNPDYHAAIIAKYLPRLKGLTFYPNGARPGQPLTPVSVDVAMAHKGVVFEENEERCLQGVCGL